MNIFIFKSEANRELRAFSDDQGGHKQRLSALEDEGREVASAICVALALCCG